MPPKKQTISFEQGLARIDEIVRSLESGEMVLSASLSLYEEGTGLIKTCSKLLHQAEQKVDKLKKGPDRLPVELEFEDEE